MTLRERAIKALYEYECRVYPTLVANPEVHPGTREGDAGKVHMRLEFVFENSEDAKAFLVQNRLPTLIFNPKV